MRRWQTGKSEQSAFVSRKPANDVESRRGSAVRADWEGIQAGT
jgi:hypothetical protein